MPFTSNKKEKRVNWQFMDEGLKRGIVSRMAEQARDNQDFRKSVYNRISESAGRESIWADDLRDYIKNTTAEQFDLKQAYEKVSDDFKNDFLNEIRGQDNKEKKRNIINNKINRTLNE